MCHVRANTQKCDPKPRRTSRPVKPGWVYRRELIISPPMGPAGLCGAVTKHLGPPDREASLPFSVLWKLGRGGWCRSGARTTRGEASPPAEMRKCSEIDAACHSAPCRRGSAPTGHIWDNYFSIKK